MKKTCWRERQFALVLLLLAVGVALPRPSSAAFVEAMYDLRLVATAPFPIDRHATADSRNLSGMRITLPRPPCTGRQSDCDEVDVLNSLDGFSVFPRLRVPFSAAINLTTVNSSTVYLVRLGDVTRNELNPREIVGIDQIVWDAGTKTLSFRPEKLLDQHTRYLMVVTTGVRDTFGYPVWGGSFWDFVTDPLYYRYRCCALEPYRYELIDALQKAAISPYIIASASVFTTMSATAELEKIRDQIKASAPTAANFSIATDGSRAYFPADQVQSAEVQRQVSTAPAYAPEAVPTVLLGLIPGAVGSLSYGVYSSPEYRNSQRYIPSIYTKTGTPVVQKSNNIYFSLVLPAGPKPAGGWPVAIYGHGLYSNRETVLVGAAMMASRGIATIAIGVVGHGGGALGTLKVTRTDGSSVTLPAGGRGIDANGDGAIEPSEGITTAAPRTLIQFRDGARQTVADLMQLVHLIETNGIDADGDGSPDLDRTRIYYFGISYGAMYGPLLMAVDPAVSAGVSITGGDSLLEFARLGSFRQIPAQALASRSPSLLNLSGSGLPNLGFNDNIPLRKMGQARVNNVSGAIPIQEYFDRWEWASSPGDPLAYIQHVETNTLAGVPSKSMLMLMAKGDMTIPNPSGSALIRAGGLEDRTTYFRNDLAYAANPAVPKDPHLFVGGLADPATQGFALAAQNQIATFFQSNGAIIIDPDGSDPFFETPIMGPLPEELNFIP